MKLTWGATVGEHTMAMPGFTLNAVAGLFPRNWRRRYVERRSVWSCCTFTNHPRSFHLLRLK